MHIDLSDQETTALLSEHDRVIDGDRYPFSPRIQTRKAMRAKLRPESSREPLPPPKHYEPPLNVAACLCAGPGSPPQSTVAGWYLPCPSPGRQHKEAGMKQFLRAQFSKISRYVNPPLQRYPHSDYPALEAKHLDNPRFSANRNDLISSLRPGEGGVIAEIGVAHGDFSEFLLDELRPQQFVAFDVFNMENWVPKRQWSIERLNNMTHLEFYRQRFCDSSAHLKIEVGLSYLQLATYQDKYFDFIYIDGDHSYATVKKDLELASVKLRDDGMIVLDDYIMFDHHYYQPYGVVQAVNEFIVANDDWKVCGFALQRETYCNIAIRRSALK